jgi:hypothetical protein
LSPPLLHVTRKDTSRLIPSRFPPVGILDTIVAADDLEHIDELENWTNDRLSSELGIIMTIPAAEWVVGQPQATAVIAAYCHPHPTGGRFNDCGFRRLRPGIPIERGHAFRSKAATFSDEGDRAPLPAW